MSEPWSSMLNFSFSSIYCCPCRANKHPKTTEGSCIHPKFAHGQTKLQNKQPMNVAKFGTKQLLHAKFHPHRCKKSKWLPPQVSSDVCTVHILPVKKNKTLMLKNIKVTSAILIPPCIYFIIPNLGTNNSSFELNQMRSHAAMTGVHRSTMN